MNFHEKIRLLRNELGLTQEQVSSTIPMGITSLRNYEKDRLPDTQQLKKLKDFYKVPYEYLLNDECNTREEENLRIGEKLGISDKCITILKELSLNKKNYILEDLIEYIYNEDMLSKLEELSKINYIIETIFNSVCHKLEIIFEEKKYDDITEEQLNNLENFINYNINVREKTNDIPEQEYLRYLISNSDYNTFIDSLTYIIPTFNYKANVKEKELKGFYNYKKVKEIFKNYKTYLFTNSVIHMNNELIKNINFNN